MKIINLTPHEVNVLDSLGRSWMNFPSEGVARAKESSVVVGDFIGIPVVEKAFGEPEGLPDYGEDTFYIVSVVTANAAKAAGRTTEDLLITADPVRDPQGRILGCRSFAKI